LVAKTAPATVAIRYAQRQAIIMDPEYHNGEYHKHHTFPIHGIKVARTIGLISYLSRLSMASVFFSFVCILR
jgi:homoserine O-acetyltransferase